MVISAGTSVIVDGPFADVDAVKFNESMKAFEEATGIDVQYVGNKEFEGRSRSVSMLATRLISPTSHSPVCWRVSYARARLSIPLPGCPQIG